MWRVRFESFIPRVWIAYVVSFDWNIGHGKSATSYEACCGCWMSMWMDVKTRLIEFEFVMGAAGMKRGTTATRRYP